MTGEVSVICKTSGLIALLAASALERGKVMGAEAPHLPPESCIPPKNTPGAPCCLPNSKPGFFLPEESELERRAVSRSGGRDLGFPSRCCARTSSKQFSSVELPVELTQLLSGKKM